MDWNELVRNHEYDCVGAVVLDSSGTVRAISDGVLALGDYARDDLLMTLATDLIHPDDLARGLEVLAEVFVTRGTRADGMYRLRRKDDTYESVALRAINLGAEADDAIVMRVSIIDNRTRVSAEAFAEDVVDATRMLCHDTSLTEFFEWAMRVGERHVAGLQLIVTVITDDGPNQVHSRGTVPIDLAEANHQATPESLPPHVQSSLEEHNRGPWLAPNRVATRDEQRPERLTSILADSKGAAAGYIEVLMPNAAAPSESEWLLLAMITRVITAAMQRFELDNRLRWAADHDPLTGLVNRRKLVEAIGAHTGAPSVLCMIDLDQFSAINNSFGHQMGDDVLVAVGAQLKKASPAGAVVARMGGDEFIVWLPDDLHDDATLAHGERLRRALAIELGAPQARLRLSCSIGITAMAPDESAALAINRADTAMYESKRAGGDAVVLS